jgi:proton-coupled amino acid transporter
MSRDIHHRTSSGPTDGRGHGHLSAVPIDIVDLLRQGIDVTWEMDSDLNDRTVDQTDGEGGGGAVKEMPRVDVKAAHRFGAPNSQSGLPTAHTGPQDSRSPSPSPATQSDAPPSVTSSLGSSPTYPTYDSVATRSLSGLTSSADPSHGKGDPILRRQTSSVVGEAETSAAGEGAASFQNTTIAQATFHLFKANVGAGIFMLPTFFQAAGTIPSLFCFLLATVVVVDCMMLLLKVKHRVGRADATSYPALARFVLGPGFQKLVGLSLMCSQFVVCTLYLQYAASLCKAEVEGNGEGGKTTGSAFDTTYFLFIIFGIVLVTPLTFLTHRLHWLAAASALAAICVVFVISAGFAKAISGFFAPSSGVPPSTAVPTPLSTVPGTATESGTIGIQWVGPIPFWIKTISATVMALEGIPVVLPIENSLRPEGKGRYPAAVRATMIGVSSLYLIFALVCQFSFGSKLHASVIHILPAGFISSMARIALALSLWLSCPIQSVPAFQLMDYTFFKWRNRFLGDWEGRLLRAIVVCVLGSFAWLAGSNGLGLLMSLLGSIFGSLLCIILPSLMSLNLNRALNGDVKLMPNCQFLQAAFSRPYSWKRIRCMLYFGFGVFVMIGGTWAAIFIRE